MAFKHAADGDSIEAGQVEVCATIVAMTEKGLLLNDGVRQEWVPRKKTTIAASRDLLGHATSVYGVGDLVTALMPEWLAKAKGFI